MFERYRYWMFDLVHATDITLVMSSLLTVLIANLPTGKSCAVNSLYRDLCHKKFDFFVFGLKKHDSSKFLCYIVK